LQIRVVRKFTTLRRPSDLRSLGFFFAFIAFISFGTALFAAANEAKTGRSQQVLIYYGNETTPAAAGSKNYGVLLTSLRDHGGQQGADLAAAIEDDAKISPAVVRGEVQALLRGCGRLNADIVVFTNELTLAGRFMFCRAASSTVETAPFDGVAASPDHILDLTPLSRPEYFRAALERAGALFAERPVEAILLTHSHGGAEMALMPRVSADVADLDSAILRHILDFRDGNPSWATLKGTSKREYWRALSDVSRAYGMRFALVFRQACESGLDSFAEFRSIPNEINVIAHTAMADLPYGKIDYGALLSAAAATPDMAEAFAGNLRAQGMRVDTKWSFLLWLIPVYLWSAPTAIWFTPIGLWACWLAWMVAASARRPKINRASLPAQ
jgi:hypothetical protein